MLIARDACIRPTCSHFLHSLSQLLTRLVGQQMMQRLAMGSPPISWCPFLRRVQMRVMPCQHTYHSRFSAVGSGYQDRQHEACSCPAIFIHGACSKTRLICAGAFALRPWNVEAPAVFCRGPCRLPGCTLRPRTP